jgi:hypothetical protein
VISGTVDAGKKPCSFYRACATVGISVLRFYSDGFHRANLDAGDAIDAIIVHHSFAVNHFDCIHRTFPDAGFTADAKFFVNYSRHLPVLLKLLSNFPSVNHYIAFVAKMQIKMPI